MKNQGDWLGTFEKDIIISMGDFGLVNSCIHYEIYKSENTYSCFIFSLNVLLFSTTKTEMLHRLKPTRKEQLENEIVADLKNGDDFYE